MQVAGIAGQAAPSAVSGNGGAAASGAPFSEALAAAQDATIHTVQRGETLSHIVKTHLAAAGRTPARAEIYAAVGKVASANGLANANVIHPGQTLDLAILSPKPVTVETAADTTRADAAAVSPVAGTALPAMMPLMKAAVRTPNAAIATSTAATATRNAETSTPATRAQYFSRRAAWSSYPAPQSVGGPAHPRDEATWFELTAQVSLLDPRLAAATPRSKAAERTAATVVSATAATPWAPVLDVPGRITSAYGKRNDPFTGAPDFHEGIDIAAEFGSRIRPVCDGVVKFSGWQPGYGKVVIVRHGNGLETVYGHNATNLVRAGDRVNTESVLGLLGSTGRSTGPHLHFEARENGRSVNPMPYLQKEQIATR